MDKRGITDPVESNGQRALWEWSDQGHGLQRKDTEKGCQGEGWTDANQAECSSLPVLGRVRKWVVYSESFRFQLNPRREGEIEKQIWNKKQLCHPKAGNSRKRWLV